MGLPDGEEIMTLPFFVLTQYRRVTDGQRDTLLSILPVLAYRRSDKQESPAIADRPARRESLPKIAPIRRAYNVVADNTGLSSFV